MGQEDVIEEMDAFADSSNEQLRRVSILRAADIHWNLERRPVLCNIIGDELAPAGGSPRIMIRLQAR
jgi:hypothetical protein